MNLQRRLAPEAKDESCTPTEYSIWTTTNLGHVNDQAAPNGGSRTFACTHGDADVLLEVEVFRGFLPDRWPARRNYPGRRQLPSGTSDVGGDDIGGVPVQGCPGPVIAHVVRGSA